MQRLEVHGRSGLSQRHQLTLGVGHAPHHDHGRLSFFLMFIWDKWLGIRVEAFEIDGT
jgi:hypothetical protein